MILRRLIRRHAHLPGPVHFAFVACNRNRHRFREDPSYIYRCENLGTALQAAGHRVSFVHLSAVFNGDLPDVAVFHRPPYSLRLAVVLHWLQHRGVTLLADVDDLVFDEALAEYSPGVMNGLVVLKETRRQFAANHQALARFNAITVSTAPLAEHVRQCFSGARVGVVPNAVHRSWLAVGIAADCTSLNELRADSYRWDAPIVTYFPGTRSHDRDFVVFAEGVGAFLAKYPQARLEVTGPLRFDMTARKGQVVHREKQPFAHYHEQVRTGWVNLAPLLRTPFTRCKSALKVLEAGYWGVPTVCSPFPDADRFQGAGALYAQDAEACFEQLEAIMEPGCYREVTAKLSERVLALADADWVAQQFLRFVGSLPTGGL